MELNFEIESPEKNTPKGKVENTRISDGIFMVKVVNEGENQFQA